MNEEIQKFECPACDQRAAIVTETITGTQKLFGYETKVDVDVFECKSCGHEWCE